MMIDANILRVDLSIIRKNIDILKKLTNKVFYAVVKGNAYGLGAVEISKNIESIVDGFCVATINEALELKEAGIKKDVLVLGYIHPKNYDLLYKHDISLTVYDYDIAKSLNEMGYKIKVHIKVETGHNRLGFIPSDKSLEEIKEIGQMENLDVKGIYTHLATADGPDVDYAERQEAIFSKVLEDLGENADGWLKHISNDAGAIGHDFAKKYDLIRSGISMYGVYPSIYMKRRYDIGIEESFQLESRISFIKEIDKGDTVSYGRKFKSDRKLKVGTVSIGYADGYHRLISGRGYLLVNGKKARILGTITMDQLMVDLSGINAKIHDRVVLIGKSGHEQISVDQVADWAETISYEVMTSISSRVERVYENEE